MINSREELVQELEKIKKIENTRYELEQYNTPIEKVSRLVWDAKKRGDIENKEIADFGCGSGAFGIGCLLTGAKRVYFVDVDPKAIEITKKNVEKLVDQIKGDRIFLCEEVGDFDKEVDVVFQNPPFGCKQYHLDKLFLEKALLRAEVVYSMHTAASEKFVFAVAKDNGFRMTHKECFEFPIHKSHKVHKKERYNVKVCTFRLERV